MGEIMVIHWICGVVALLLFIYLFIALLKPEIFS
jgi:K+-transporting ATPase KdpF subunit